MAEYAELIKALRLCQFGECGCGKCYYKELKGDWCTEDNHPEFFDCDDKLKLDAAAAIEELQQIADHYEQTAKDYWKEACEYKAQLPKRGKWELIDGAEPMRWCSRCKYMSWETSNYCPRCGAKMEVQE